MSYRSEGLSEQPRQQPAGHNDRQEVDPPMFPEIPYINEDAFSEESLYDEEVPREGVNPERPESSAKRKGTSVKEDDPPGSIASSLYVVCQHCIDVLKHIKSTGSCNEPSHKYNKDYFVNHSGINPIRKATSFSKDSHWEHCRRLLQSQCSHRGKDEAETVVYMDQSQKEVFEIRCPLNYLRMQNKQYQCNHTVHECMHRPKHNCNFPHSKVEEDIWNAWKKTASANVQSRTAKQFYREIKEACRNLVPRKQPDLQASQQLGSCFISQNAARLTESSQPVTERVVNETLLDAPLTAVNYKDKFLHLNELEMQEHEQSLERCNGIFDFGKYEHDTSFDKRHHKYKWYGSLEVPQDIGDYVQQAATQVELKKQREWKLTGDIIYTPKFHRGKYILLVGFTTNDKPIELQQPGSKLRVQATFFLKYRYFMNLQSAIESLPDAVTSKLVPEHSTDYLNDDESLDVLSNFPGGFQLDDEQRRTCQELLRASSDLPFLITGPFGAGKTRVIAAAALCILKALPKSRILIATHHRKTADEYVEKYFTEDLVNREGLKVVRLVSKETPRTRLSGLTKVSEMVKDNLANFQLIITTFILSMGLSHQLKQGHFTHIFIDEAAQAREPETIAAFRLAGHETKIVIGGDDMQVGPMASVLGKVPREKGLSVSLLVRLHKLFRKLDVMSHLSKLLINHRCAPDIIRLPNRLFYKCRLQTRAESLRHRDWDKVVYFVCSSLDSNKLAAGSIWSTQEELYKEAVLEVGVMVQLVQEYIGEQFKPEPESKASLNVNPTSVGKVDPSSVCVMFPTRFTEYLWRRAVCDSPELRKVTSVVVYDIQGREFEAVFVCTAEPVNQDYSPSNPVKSMCDRYMCNTIITRPRSLLVAVGNPFRLRKIEQKMPKENPACWSEYISQCWEGDSLRLSATLREDLEPCKKQLDELKELMFLKATSKLHISPQAIVKDEGKDEDADTTILQEYRRDRNSGWKLGRTCVEVEVPGKQGLLTECKLDGCRATPSKDPHSEPFIIPTVDERKCAFDGAIVLVKEVGRTEDGRTGKVVSVQKQGAVDPMICTVDPLSPLILIPVSGKNPKMVNQTEDTDDKGRTKCTSAEAMMNSPGCHTHSVDGIPFKAAIDMFFIVQPLEWSVQERYPVGAVVGVLPKRPPMQLAERILAIQHKLPSSSQISTHTASSRPSTDSCLSKPPAQFKSAICIKDLSGQCTSAFSVETKKNHFTVAVHVSNVIEQVSAMEEYKEKRFREWWASHLLLPQHVAEACDFSENPIQKAITVLFKVEGPVCTTGTTQKDMLTAELSITLMSIQETMVQCSNVLSMSDVEDILVSLQRGHIGDRKLKQRTAGGCIDALAILYGTAEYHHKTRLGHGGYPLLELDSYDFPETGKMVNELLTMANSEAAKVIANTFPNRALLMNQEVDHVKEQSISLAVLPVIYSELNLQGHATPKPAQTLIVGLEKLKALVKALKKANFLEVRQRLYFLPCHAWITPLQETIGSALTPEQFTVGCSQPAGKTPKHCVRFVTYTSFTDPFRCVGDIYVQEQLLAAMRKQELSGSVEDVRHVAKMCNMARLNTRGYGSHVSKLHWAYFARNSFIRVQSVVKSVQGGKLHLCYHQYENQNNVQEKIVAQATTTLCHPKYTAKVTTLSGMCQVGSRSEYQIDRVAQDYASCTMVTAPNTVLVPTDTMHTVVKCIQEFKEEKIAMALESLQQLLKQEHSSSTQPEPHAEPELRDAHFLLLEFPLNLSSHQLVDVWMRMDSSHFIPKLVPALLDIAHDIRVCLHHTEHPEACFTSSGAVMVPHQVHHSVDSYVSEWAKVLLAEAAYRSVERKWHILINDVHIRFTKFEALDVVGSEEFYRPGEVTMVLPKAFVEDRQDVFPLEQGDLLCARYEVNLLEEKAGLELLERHGNCFPPRHEPVGRLVLHMVVERVEVMDTKQEVMMSQEMVHSELQVYLRVVGEQGACISPLMKDLLVANKHPCQVELVPMESGLRRVYQCLSGMERLMEASELGKNIIFGHLGRFKAAQEPDCPPLAEMEKEYPKLTHLWDKSDQESLNASQSSALKKAYHDMFHVIQGPPGTGKLEVAVHLAYAFAQKNKTKRVTTTDTKQPCVLLCAPSDTAVDSALSLLKGVAGSGDKDIHVLRIYSREVEGKCCPGPYQHTIVFEGTATANYSIPQSVEKFALHNLAREKVIQYSNNELPDQSRKYLRLVAKAERQVIQEGQFDVVLCTCSEAGSPRIQHHFTPFQCIVYEASLATEPETVAAIGQTSYQVVLIGDHSSVCPPVRSKVARLAGLGVSLFERYAHKHTRKDNEYRNQLYSFLEEQDRMVAQLCEFPSQEFYGERLKASSKVKPWMFAGLDFPWSSTDSAGNRLPIVFCNVSGIEEMDQAMLKSAEDAILNRTEAEKVVDIVKRIVTVIVEGKGNYNKKMLAVLTTTEAQKNLIQELLKKWTSVDETVIQDVSSQVLTISASQGIKASYVILSTVRSCPTDTFPKGKTALLDHQWMEEHLGILCQPHHTCLALTTGRHGLVIVGDKNLLCLNDTWHRLVEHCMNKRCFVCGDDFPPLQPMSPRSESHFRSEFMSHKELGKGTFGVVYECVNRVDGRFYAVKRIKLPCKKDAREKVMREAKALAQLDHEHIVRYYTSWVEKEWEGCWSAEEEDESCSSFNLSATPTPSVQSTTSTSHTSHGVNFEYARSLASTFEDPSGSKSETESCQDSEPSSALTGDGIGNVSLPEHLFIQMELCCKDSLRDWLENNLENRSRRIVLQHFEQILKAVCYVHQKGMMHRDLKPSNIFFSINDYVGIKIGDFGLVTDVFDSFPMSSRLTSRDCRLDTHQNKKGRTCSIGTSLYISPEQKKGIEYNERVDVYSLGVIFFEMNHPFITDMERVKVLTGVHSGTFPEKFKEHLPKELEMVQWMLSSDPTKRPSAEQVATSEILKQIKDGVQATPDQDCLPKF